MPYRAFRLFVAVTGVAMLVALLVFGVNLHRAARTGPGWKRRLVAAGWALLATIGVAPGCNWESDATVGTASSAFDADELALISELDASSIDPEFPIPGGVSLDKTEQWKGILDAWRTAAPMAASKQSTTAELKAVDGKFATAKRCIERLVEEGLLSESESELLISDAVRLRREIYSVAPTDLSVTCYMVMYVSPAQESLDRLKERLPLLKKMAESGKVQPAVLRKVVSSMRADIAVLRDGEELGTLAGERYAEACELRRAAIVTMGEIERISDEMDGV